MPHLDTSQTWIRLLGHTSIQSGGVTVTSFRSNRVPALLGLLLAEPGPHQREEVAQLLWPEADSEVCRHNLRQTLVYLRGALGEQSEKALVATRSQIGLNPGVLRSDVETLLDTERYRDSESKRPICEEAVSLYEGPFLQGIEDEWVRDQRSHLAQVYIRALLYLADAEMDEQPAKALEYAERAVLEEPLMDGARARKLRALVRMGENAVAQLEYEAFADLLDQELGITPSDAVREALNDAQRPPQPQMRKPDRSNVSNDLSFALDTLGLGDRPHLAIELAVAATPHWIEVGTPGLGIAKLKESVARTGTRIPESLKVRVTLSLADLTYAQGDMVETERLIDELVKKKDRLSESLWARVLLYQARLRLAHLDGRTALAKSKTALALAECCEDRTLELDALMVISVSALYIPDYELALAMSDQTTTIANRLGHKLAASYALLWKARSLEAIGKKEEAHEAALQSTHHLHGLISPKATNYRMGVARLLEDLDALDDAEAGYRQALVESQAYEDRYSEAMALTYLGDLVQSTGRPREAISLHIKGLAIRRELHQRLGAATSLRGLGKAYCDLNELHAAREALSESAHDYLSEDALPGYASVLLALAQVEEKGGHKPLALRLARRARKLLRGMTTYEKKSIGRSGISLIGEATALIERCNPTPVA
ncbi:MAG TPA: BTAD domain-containing putative transcriptional regulator [Fimbriimonas sp.]|nr:BTAD domain-containing putative transcriptional regulator [Fimbriimonas sp.]